MSMAFSVLCQEIKSYSVMGKQAGEFKGIKGIASASTGNLLAEIIRVLLLNWEREREGSGVSEELSEGTDNVMSIFRPLPHQNYNKVQVSFLCSLKEGTGRNSNVVKLFFRSGMKSVSPFPIVVLVCSDTCGVTGIYLLHFKFISYPNMNELLSDKPKEMMRMGQVWGNALRCWIKWHIFWNVAKPPIAFKDETETVQGIIQHWPKCVMVWNEDWKSGK